MKLAAVMVSCPERDSVRRQTLENLSSTDWEGGVDVVLDNGTDANRVARIDANWRRALDRAAASDADAVLVLEDDLDFNRYLRSNLVAWPPLRVINGGQPFFGSIYNPGLPQMHTWLESHCYMMYPDGCWGAQACVMSPAMARYFLARWDDVSGECDIRMPRLAGRLVPIYYHRPSLVDHVNAVSTWGGRHHRASDFARDWRVLIST